MQGDECNWSVVDKSEAWVEYLSSNVGVGSLYVIVSIQIDACPTTESERVVADAVAALCVRNLLEAYH